MNKDNEKNGRGKRILTVKKKLMRKIESGDFRGAKYVKIELFKRKKEIRRKMIKTGVNCMVSGKE